MTFIGAICFVRKFTAEPVTVSSLLGRVVGRCVYDSDVHLYISNQPSCGVDVEIAIPRIVHWNTVILAHVLLST